MLSSNQATERNATPKETEAGDEAETQERQRPGFRNGVDQVDGIIAGAD